jgi:hypothetical protein
MSADAARSDALVRKLFARARSSGRLRRDAVVHDVTLLLEGCAAVRVPDPERTRVLRQRTLAMLVAGLTDATDPPLDPLPGPAPRASELNWRWQTARP